MRQVHQHRQWSDLLPVCSRQAGDRGTQYVPLDQLGGDGLESIQACCLSSSLIHRWHYASRHYKTIQFHLISSQKVTITHLYHICLIWVLCFSNGFGNGLEGENLISSLHCTLMVKCTCQICPYLIETPTHLFYYISYLPSYILDQTEETSLGPETLAKIFTNIWVHESFFNCFIKPSHTTFKMVIFWCISNHICNKICFLKIQFTRAKAYI